MINKKSFVIEYPEVATEWHPTKNGNLDPNDFSSGSGKKVWWLLHYEDIVSGKQFDFEWQAPIYDRCKLKRGCPYLSINPKVWSGFNDLETINPTLAKEWDYDKNDITPNKVTAFSNRSVYWKCKKCNKGWKSTINNRSKGNGCPFCGRKRTIIGKSDLKTENIRLAMEWHPIKNGTLRPEDVTSGSSRKVWWKCAVGHEWQATVSSRNRGNGCPVCSKYGTSFPEQAILYYCRKYFNNVSNREKINKVEVDVYIPDTKVAIEYDGYVFHRRNDDIKRDNKKDHILEKSGIRLYRIREKGLPQTKSAKCIFRANNEKNDDLSKCIVELLRLIGCTDIDVDINRDYVSILELFYNYVKENNLAVQNPKVADEWNYEKNGELRPEMIRPNSMHLVWWKCAVGHEWQATVNARNGKGRNCPYCSNQKVLPGFNDFKSKHPNLATEWDYEKNEGINPDEVTESTHKEFWWVGSCGHSWKAKVSNRTKGHGCPYCNSVMPERGKNDVATLYPELVLQLHPRNGEIDLSNYLPNSDRKLWWKCTSCGYEWERDIKHRTRRGQGCPACSNSIVKIGENDLATLYPEIAEEWHPIKNGALKSTDVKSQSNKKVWWLGKCGHEWEAPIYLRVKGVDTCPYCNGRKLLRGYNDLDTLYPEIAKEWHTERNKPLMPSDVRVAYKDKVWWKCSKGHEWLATIRSRVNGSKCGVCTNRIIVPGINDLATINPLLAKEWHPTKNGEKTPSMYAPGAGEKVWWLCPKCGYEWQTAIYNRQMGKGCSVCNRGFGNSK